MKTKIVQFLSRKEKKTKTKTSPTNYLKKYDFNPKNLQTMGNMETLPTQHKIKFT